VVKCYFAFSTPTKWTNAFVGSFLITAADALLFENVHYAVHCSEVLDLIVHASFINTAIHLQFKRYSSPTVSA